MYYLPCKVLLPLQYLNKYFAKKGMGVGEGSQGVDRHLHDFVKYILFFLNITSLCITIIVISLACIGYGRLSSNV